MGSMYAQGFADMAESGTITWDLAIEAHLSGNFYPRLPQEVIESTKEAIAEFNNGEITIEECSRRCYLKTTDALLRLHGAFLNEDRLEN